MEDTNRSATDVQLSVEEQHTGNEAGAVNEQVSRWSPHYTPATEPASAAPEVEAKAVSEPSLPSCNDYELHDLIGEGGMGSVYRARHKQLGTEVAVKVIHPQLVYDDYARKRFELEAKAASELTHANLVAVYGHGRTGRGEPFLVMDLIDGKSLADIIKNEGFLDVQRALDIVIQICEALNHAHYKGVIHRDLKPSNVLVTKSESGAEVVKVLDFGIAKILESEDSSITKTGDVFGSPAYMSPEQCQGLNTDARSDIYSAGCLLYEALTGRLPFAGESAIETIIKQVADTPIFDRHSNTHDIPNSVEDVVLNALEKDAEQRYQTMEQFLADLRRVRQGQPPLKKRPRRAMLWKGSKVQSTMNVAVVGLAVVAATIFAWQHLGNMTRQTPAINRAPVTTHRTGEDLRPIEIFDTQGKLLFRAEKSKDLADAAQQAVKAGISLSHANFAGANFVEFRPHSEKSPDLSEADFSGASFDQCDFSYVNLAGADFNHAHLHDTRFYRCNLSKSNFKNCTQIFSRYPVAFDFCNFTGANFSDADMSDIGHTRGIYARICTFTDTNFSKADLGGARFERCNFTAADFSAARMMRTDFRLSILSRAKFIGAEVQDLRLNECLGADLSGARGEHVER